MRAAFLPAALLAILLAGCGGGGGVPPQDVFPSLATFQAASLVLGQATFAGQSENGGGPASASTLDGPAAPVEVGGRLYVPDVGNNRVLGYLTAPGTNGAAADFVLGQPDATSTASTVSATGMSMPTAVTSDRGIVYVVEFGNHRVLVFRSPPATTGAAADAALGQPGLDTNTPGANEVRMTSPVGACARAGKLLVADAGNHRVLIWNTLPTTHGVPADLVLGQATFTQSQPNRGSITPAADTLYNPFGVWTDGTRVAVADKGNNRVLLWRAFPTTNGQAADLVLGQSSFSASVPAGGATGLRQPSDVDGGAGALLVVDGDNHRLLAWSTFPLVDGAPADVVVGQGDFAHVAPDDDDQDGFPDGAASARTFDGFGGFLFARASGTRLWVGDFRNHRVLRFDGE